MGLFGGYNKAGPGVSKNGPEKKSFFVFWELYARNFLNLLLASLIYMLVIYPCIIPFLATFFYVTEGSVNLYTILTMLPMVLIGPATCGFAYITRNYTRRKHVFLWHDFWDKFKKNFKQGLIAGAVDLILIIVSYYNITFYYYQGLEQQFFVYMLIAYIFLLVIYLSIRYYVYTMIVTFDLKMRSIYKNAFLFAVAKLGQNLLLTLTIFVTGFLLWLLPITPWINYFAIMPVLLFGFWGYLINFIVFPNMSKHMIEPYEKERGEREAAEAETSEQTASKQEQETVAIFKDTAPANSSKKQNRR